MIRLVILLLCLAGGAVAESVARISLPPLPDAVGAQFGAVGRVNIAGFKTKGSCSGTLIAPDVVLTAGHCVSASGRPTRVFVAGWKRGDYIAARRSTSEMRHPAYLPQRGGVPLNDVGLVFLDTPITEVAPLPLAAPQADAVALLGYHQFIPHLLSGQLDCPVQPFGAALMQVLCPVTSGNSGGPVLEPREGGGWAVVGVVSSKFSGTAIVVPVPDWVRAELEAHARTR